MFKKEERAVKGLFTEERVQSDIRAAATKRTRMQTYANSYKILRSELSKDISKENQKDKEKITISIHVWSGAEFESSITGGQRFWFDQALTKLVSEYAKEFAFIVEYRSNKDIRENNYSVEEMFDWLMASDIHYILTHVHQGIDLNREYPVWNLPDIISHLNLLEFHPGFPAGALIKCPVFQQDKFKYVDALMKKKIALPKLKSDLTSD